MRYNQVKTFITRLDWHSTLLAAGLLLILQLGVLVAAGIAFATVLDDVTENDELTSLDPPVSQLVISTREAWLNRSFEIITWAGAATVLVPLVLLTGLILRRITRSWNSLIFLGVSLAGATALSTLIKLAVARPRPPYLALVDAAGYAFPSGHTTAATAAWLSLALVLGARAPRWGPKIVLVTAAVVIIGLVGVSRIYLGVHAPTDVLGGWSLGALWVVTVAVAYRLLTDKLIAEKLLRQGLFRGRLLGERLFRGRFTERR